jgi:hypothetical protein
MLIHCSLFKLKPQTSPEVRDRTRIITPTVPMSRIRKWFESTCFQIRRKEHQFRSRRSDGGSGLSTPGDDIHALHL